MMVVRLGLGVLLAALIGIFAACSDAPPAKPADAEAVEVQATIYLVRHAEKVLGVQDPNLTEAGFARAAALVGKLSDVEINYVHSTDYARTRQTAQPVADDKWLPLQIYDPSDLESFAAQIIEAGGTHLVVGHSNTTPDLVAALGGEPGEEIDEAGEYDRLYIVQVLRTGGAQTELLRYGALYVPAR